jgi:hypothetical protein
VELDGDVGSFLEEEPEEPLQVSPVVEVPLVADDAEAEAGRDLAGAVRATVVADDDMGLERSRERLVRSRVFSAL